jgi:hypothetical protein
MPAVVAVAPTAEMADQVAQVAVEMQETVTLTVLQQQLILAQVAVEHLADHLAAEQVAARVHQELLSFDMQSNKGEI